VQLIHLNTLDALRRVQGFLDRQLTALGTIVTAALRGRLDDATTQLATFQVEQNTAAGAARSETANQAGYRKDFYARFMRPITRIAKASLRTTAEYVALVVPSSGVRNADFVGTAQALADAASKHEKAFVEGGMPVDFLTQLRAAITQLTASKAAGDGSLSRREAATKGIKDGSKIGHDVLVVLDSVIAPALKHNAALLADWKASKRIAATVTPLPAQPTGLPSTNVATAASDTTAASPAAPTATPSNTAPVAPAPQTAKAAA
jgi:hypothetical protein